MARKQQSAQPAGQASLFGGPPAQRDMDRAVSEARAAIRNLGGSLSERVMKEREAVYGVLRAASKDELDVLLKGSQPRWVMQILFEVYRDRGFLKEDDS